MSESNVQAAMDALSKLDPSERRTLIRALVTGAPLETAAAPVMETEPPPTYLGTLTSADMDAIRQAGIRAGIHDDPVVKAPTYTDLESKEAAAVARVNRAAEEVLGEPVPAKKLPRMSSATLGPIGRKGVHVVQQNCKIEVIHTEKPVSKASIKVIRGGQVVDIGRENGVAKEGDELTVETLPPGIPWTLTVTVL